MSLLLGPLALVSCSMCRCRMPCTCSAAGQLRHVCVPRSFMWGLPSHLAHAALPPCQHLGGHSLICATHPAQCVSGYEPSNVWSHVWSHVWGPQQQWRCGPGCVRGGVLRAPGVVTRLICLGLPASCCVCHSKPLMRCPPLAYPPILAPARPPTAGDPQLAPLHAGAWLGKPTPGNTRKIRFFQLSHDGSTLRWGWNK